MTDKAAPVAAPVSEGATVASSASPKKSKAPSTKKPRAKPSHPKVADMVNTAIKELKERGGSSLQAIKKYMAGTYKVDAEKQAPFIKRYIKSALASGALVQIKGKGAAGSFKLSASAVKAATVKPKAAKKVVKPKTAAKKAPAAKKTTAAKKAVSPSKPKKVAVKKPTTATSEKKKSTKGPAAKPPKPKTTKAKPAPKSPPKKVKAAAPKKVKPAAAASKPKKAAPKKAAVAKK
ncbi:histone H1-like [Venturia canescens]|uniref:histone H1-like n=1 Tax=Venturia canescens TaxID=32260 RepID=UPI001C9C7E50|nr:histone H1-like [Venturia canescens]